MNRTILTLTLVMMSALLVACSEDDKGGMTMAQICAKAPASPYCQNGQLSPEGRQALALAGGSAVAGKPQVLAALGGTPEKGQVPNTATLPASIQERAKAVKATMNAMNEDPDFSLTNGTRTLVGANYVPTSAGGGGSSSAGELVLPTLPDRAPAEQAPTYSAPQADLNSVFSQPEALGAGAAH